MPSLLQRCPSRLSNVFGQRTNSRSAERGKENPTRSRDCSASNLSFPILPRPAGSRSGLSGSYAAMDKHRRHSEAEFGGFDESEKGMGWGRGLGKKGRGRGYWCGAARRQTVAKVERREGRGIHANFRLESGDPPPSLPSFPFHASSQGSTSSSFVIHEAVTAQQSQSQHAAFHIRRSPVVSRHLRL